MNGVFVDSSVFLSLEDPAEHSHAFAMRTFRELVSARSPLVSTNFVFDETYTLILTRLGRHRAVAWGESARSSKLIEFVRVDESHEQAAWDLILTFGDKDFSYTDATSFAVMSSLAIEEALSLDRHFKEYGRVRVLP
jgi:predicted nucleic acid-binding protein